MRNHTDEIDLALAGGAPRQVPFTFYDVLFPPGFDPTPLQARGLAICARRDVMRIEYRNTSVNQVRESNGDIRTVYLTPVGTLTSFQRAAVLAYTPVEHPIKKRDDYRAAIAVVNDRRHVANYEPYLAAIGQVGPAGKVIAHTCYEPLMDVQLTWIGQERFCYELADNEDALLELHDALVMSHRQMYDVVADSPADYVLYGGNVVPEMLGPNRVREMIAPAWNAFADRLHERGKKLGCHLDANNRLILDTVRQSALDFVEAFTPPPDCNVSVAEARSEWAGKRLWINFPSSVHLQSDEHIKETTLEILRQAGDRRGFLMGVTEDIPREHIERSCSAILEALQSCPL